MTFINGTICIIESNTCCYSRTSRTELYYRYKLQVQIVLVPLVQYYRYKKGTGTSSTSSEQEIQKLCYTCTSTKYKYKYLVMMTTSTKRSVRARTSRIKVSFWMITFLIQKLYYYRYQVLHFSLPVLRQRTRF
jgi:hypothetical protein